MKLLLLAGEESGVLYAEQIAKALRGRSAAVEIRGYGDYGFRTSDLAVMGVGQVLKKIFYFLRVKRTMERAIDEWKPDVVCTVDYPGMNLKLAAYAKARGVRTVHVVCPQVWAWKKGRIPKIEAALDRLCCFFPFEPELFSPGFAEFVGHPLVDEMSFPVPSPSSATGADKSPTPVPSASRRQALANGASVPAPVAEDRDGTVLALLPGSRLGEVEKHLPTLLKVVETLRREIPDLKVVIPAANERAYKEICSLVDSGGEGTRRPTIVVTHGGAREVLRDADAAVVASGTATLEAALAGCPTVLVYKVGWLFAFLARRFIKGIRHIGLANIIAEKAGAECPMPELLQENFTVEKVLAAVRPLLADPSANAAARQSLAETMALLKSDGGAIERIVTTLQISRDF